MRSGTSCGSRTGNYGKVKLVLQRNKFCVESGLPGRPAQAAQGAPAAHVRFMLCSLALAADAVELWSIRAYTISTKARLPRAAAASMHVRMCALGCLLRLRARCAGAARNWEACIRLERL